MSFLKRIRPETQEKKKEPEMPDPTKTDTTIYMQAMKLDIMTILEGENIGVFEIRKIQGVAKAMVDFLNCLDTFSQREGWGDALRETEGKAPLLHAALRDKVFDGQDAFNDLYTAMLEKWASMDRAEHEFNDTAKRLLAGNRRAEIADHLNIPALPALLEQVRAKRLSEGGVDVSGALETGDDLEATDEETDETEGDDDDGEANTTTADGRES